jgi:anti-anti-sigma factor
MDASPGLALSMVRSNDSVVVSVRGELDFGGVTGMTATLESAVGDGEVTSCTLDCEEVTFIDSEAVKALLQLRRRLAHAGVDFALRNCSKPVMRLVTLLGVRHYLLGPEDDEPGQYL